MPRRKAPKLQLSRLPNCRFGFPHPQTGFDVTFAEGQAMLMNSVTRKHEMDGSVSMPMLSDIAKSKFGKDELLLANNNPTLAQHIPELLQIWRANNDCKIITSHSALCRYLTKYVTKVEEMSDTMDYVTQNAIFSYSDGEADARKALQSALMKSLTNKDVSRQEMVFSMAIKRDLVEMTLTPRFASMSECKTIRIEGKNEGDKVGNSSQGMHEIYWRRSVDDNFKTACELYEANPEEWRNRCHPNYKCVTAHILELF